MQIADVEDLKRILQEKDAQDNVLHMLHICISVVFVYYNYRSLKSKWDLMHHQCS